MKRKPPGQADLRRLAAIAHDVRNGVPTIKHAYFGPGARKFLDILDSEEYGVCRAETTIIENNLDALREFARDRHLVVLGTGDGRKVRGLLGGESGATLVDISPGMLGLCRKALAGLGAVGLNSMEADFEQLDFRIFGSAPVFVFLGGTLGNVEDPERFLGALGSVPGARLILGMEVPCRYTDEKIAGILSEYKNEEGFRFVFYPLEMLGFRREWGEMDVRFSREARRVEEKFIVRKMPGQGVLEASPELAGVDEALLSISYKIPLEEFIGMIRDAGFAIHSRLSQGMNCIFLLEAGGKGPGPGLSPP